MSDARTVRVVAVLIGLVALAAVVGGITLLAQGQPADAALFSLAGTALGYLAGLTSGASGPVPVVGAAGGPPVVTRDVEVDDDPGDTPARTRRRPPPT